MRKTSVLGIFSALLLVAVAAGAYAHGQTPESSTSRWNMMGHMISLEDMDEMHESMTEGLDPELKEQMDLMHEGCTGSFSGGGSMMGGRMG
jgi:hypothetical protein